MLFRTTKNKIFSIVIALVILGGVLLINSPPKQLPTKALTTNSIGVKAPNGSFRETNGQIVKLSSFKGKRTLVWFVATWCSSCAVGTQAIAANMAKFKAAHIHVIELELYNDLGQTGQSISSFGSQYGGKTILNHNWTLGTASSAMTLTYDPKSYLDIYYLIGKSGKIKYINSSPAVTIPNILSNA